LEYLEEFLHDLSEDLKQRLFAPSIKFLARKYYVKYGIRINEKTIQDYILNDNRFIKVNNIQIASKSRLAKYIETLTSTMDSINDDEILKKLKEKLFVSEIDKSILKKCQTEKPEYQYVSNKIPPILCFKEEQYDINSLKDIVDVGLDKGYLSINVIEEASKYFEMHHNDIVDELISKGIQIRLDENISFEYPITKEEKTIYTSDSFHHARNNKSYYELSCSDNILLTDLRMNEIITCIFLVTFKEFLNFNYISTKHLREIGRIKIAEIYNGDIINTFWGNEVTVVFRRYLSENYEANFHISLMNKYKDSQQLSKCLEIKKLTENVKLWEIIKEPLKNLLLSHEIVHRFTNLILLTNKAGKQSMFDIVKYAITNEMEWELKNILIGKKATSGIKPINNKSDVCFSCSIKKCKVVSNKIKEHLLFYRYIYVDSFIKDLNNNVKQYKQILDDIFLLKFLVPYTIAVSTKQIFIELNIIKPARILYKNRGLYCPYDDEWVVSK